MASAPPDDSVLEAALAEEIRRLHRFFVDWFSGSCPRSSQSFQENFGDYLAPDFELVQPNGERVDRAAILSGIEAAYGVNPDFRIQIRKPRLVSREGPLLAVSYEEWQKGARNTSPPDNARSALGLLRLCDGPEPRFLWLQLQETSLPKAVVEEDVFDF
jgi:hypothetical protein